MTSGGHRGRAHAARGYVDHARRVGSAERNRIDTTLSAPGLESLYAQDLVARINAEPAARSSAGVPVPQLAVDPQLQADAQAWSAHLAAIGSVQDPSLPPCNEQANQVCVLAATSGDTGYGYWPGDGMDGMNGDYMASAPHRQNQLGAAYNMVGVGVTCSGNQAFTVELFGYTYGDLPYRRGSGPWVLPRRRYHSFIGFSVCQVFGTRNA